tara:strand:- start:2461 stop:2961 length:501 start_codon:yes stop_codon:yes gene_type:complete
MSILLATLFIFSLRVVDQSLGTMRALYVNKGKPYHAALLGFLESVIWILAISQVIKDIDDPLLVVAYSAGFAAGTILGSYIEQSIGIGNLVVRVFASVESPSVAQPLRDEGYGVTVINGEGKDGGVRIYWCIIPRRKLKSVLKLISEVNPDAYITTDSANPTSINK